MIHLCEIHPVTDFTRKPKEYIQRIKETGNPEVLTVNGHAEIVVQSADAYQRLLEAAELSETLPVLQKSLAEAKQGKGKPARDVLKKLAASVGVEFE
ncbi:MAG TPA: type II toxin-antitoxin system Phd/YefM family antitoxin [Tepidisphaeraceae bacterium]|nr:type II toxin-antitoxin system Phd/YefM family antitoxin [Tepidisphaeraceae bacterium]